MTRSLLLLLIGFVLVSTAVPSSFAQSDSDQSKDRPITELKLKNWDPRTMMDKDPTEVLKPAYPAIDTHNHLSRVDGDVKGAIKEMNAAGVYSVVNLDGGTTVEKVKRTVEQFDKAHPGRFMTFARVDWSNADKEGWGEKAAETLAKSFEAGAKGLKVSKDLGLVFTYTDGSLVKIDDPRLNPIWETCAEYDKPVLIHSADPKAFFTPLDRFNERWHELNENPDWLFYGDKYPSRMSLLKARNRVIGRHPDVTFIGAHVCNSPENLDLVAKWLDTYPNLITEIDARISELGRQPYSSREFLINYQDRVMFGTDTAPDREAYRIYYRFLETKDEYFDPRKSHHQQGFWMIYGVYLPDQVLEKIYYKNALKLFPTLQKHRKELVFFHKNLNQQSSESAKSTNGGQ